MSQEESMSPEKSDIEVVNKFVAENKRKVKKKFKLKCGDGRYTKEQGDGAISAFGADTAYLLAVKAALKEKGISVNNQRLLQAYWIARKSIFHGEEITTDIHTDEHNRIVHGETPKIGCGHIASAANPKYSDSYGLSSHEVRKFYDDLLDFFDVRVTTLKGKHKEKGVLFIRGENEGDVPEWTVDSQSEKGESYFTVDVAGFKEFAKQVTPRLGFKVEFEDVYRHFDNQMNATAAILAGNLPKYDVIFNKAGDFKISPLA